MKEKSKKIIHIFLTVLCGLIGIRYPKLEETAKEVIEEVNELLKEE